MQRMQPTAVSEVVEQLFRVAVGLSAAISCSSKDSCREEEQAGGGDIMHGAGGGSLGASAGALAGLIVILIIYSRSRFPGIETGSGTTGGTKRIRQRYNHADNKDCGTYNHRSVDHAAGESGRRGRSSNTDWQRSARKPRRKRCSAS